MGVFKHIIGTFSDFFHIGNHKLVSQAVTEHEMILPDKPVDLGIVQTQAARFMLTFSDPTLIKNKYMSIGGVNHPDSGYTFPYDAKVSALSFSYSSIELGSQTLHIVRDGIVQYVTSAIAATATPGAQTISGLNITLMQGQVLIVKSGSLNGKFIGMVTTVAGDWT